jgi:hypothetical protein
MNHRTALIIGGGLLALASSLPAQPARITSAYTRLDIDKCIRLDRDDVPESASWRCRGYAGIPLFVQNGDERYDVDAGKEDADDLFASRFDYPGSTVEWRLNRGKPFAIIYRLTSASRDEPKSSRLIVETVGGRSPGCRIASIDGSLPSANALARRAADAMLHAPIHCLTSE